MLPQDPSRDYARRSVFARNGVGTVSQPWGRIAPDRVSPPFARFEQRQALQLWNLKGRGTRPDTHRCTRRDAFADPCGDTMPRTPLSAARWTATSLPVASCRTRNTATSTDGRTRNKKPTGVTRGRKVLKESSTTRRVFTRRLQRPHARFVFAVLALDRRLSTFYWLSNSPPEGGLIHAVDQLAGVTET